MKPWTPSERAAMTGAERAVADALVRLGDGATAEALSAAAQVLPAACYRALKRLQMAGLVAGKESPTLDRWGRPVTSTWSAAPKDEAAVARALAAGFSPKDFTVSLLAQIDRLT